MWRGVRGKTLYPQVQHVFGPLDSVLAFVSRPGFFNGTQLRGVMLDGEPWFVAADACRVLGYALTSGTTMALKPLAADEKRLVRRSEVPKDYMGTCVPCANFVSRPGLFKLIAGSRRPEAVEFDRWVRHEVLPQIMDNGGYMARGPSVSASEPQSWTLGLRPCPRTLCHFTPQMAHLAPSRIVTLTEANVPSAARHDRSEPQKTAPPVAPGAPSYTVQMATLPTITTAHRIISVPLPRSPRRIRRIPPKINIAAASISSARMVASGPPLMPTTPSHRRPGRRCRPTPTPACPAPMSPAATGSPPVPPPRPVRRPA